MRTYSFLLLLACIIGSARAPSARAQSQPQEGSDLTVTGTSRLRYELIDGQLRADFNDGDELLNIRTTLAVTWVNDDWRFGGEIYDSRAYLADRGTPLTTGEVNALELVQAFVTRHVRFGERGALSLQAGRFLVNLGSRRLVAADDYRNTTNSYTGLRADLALAGGLTATALYTLPQLRLPDKFEALRRAAVRMDRESFDLVLWGGLVAKSHAIGAATLEGNFFHLGERDAPGRPTRNRSLNTFGARLVREPKPGKLDYEVEGFFQRGTISANATAGAATQSVSASFVHLEAGYSWKGGWKPRLSIEYDRASSDRPGGRYARFDTVFGMRRGELAPAGLYNAIGRANLSSPALRLEVVPDKRIDAFVSFRPIWLAERTDAFSTTGVRDATGRSGNHGGDQVDARVRLWVVPNLLQLEVDGVFLRKGRFLKDAPNAPGGGTTRYLSLNGTARF